MSAGLAGTRVLITRSEEDGAELARPIESAGGEAVLVPMIRIAPPEESGPLDEARKTIADADWVVLTSRHAALAMLDRLAPPADRSGKPRIGVVGRGTERAVRRSGWPVDLTAPPGGAASLASAMLERGELKGDLVYHPRSSLARNELARLLEEAGATVRSFEAYRTLPPDESETAERLGRAGRIDLVLFASPSAVRHYLSAATKAGLSPEKPAAVAIGPTTAAALREAGFPRVTESKSPGADDLVAALKSARSEG